MANSGVREVTPSLMPEQTPAPFTPRLAEADTIPLPVVAPHSASARRTRRTSLVHLAAAIAAPIVTFLVTLVLAVAPLAATLVSLWALWTALATVARLVMLARAGNALTSPETPTLLGSLDTAARAGFLTIGYLALIFALITLMSGLFGRRWGRLFVLPGAAFSLTALALMGIGALFAAPLASLLPIPPAWLIPLALYALVDAALVSGVLVDARLTRSPSATGKRRAEPRSPKRSAATPA